MIRKQKPSVFFGTNLTSYLTLLGCALSLNYRVSPAEEGCFDRSEASHAINLCDMNAKYADVVKTSEVLAFFDTLPAGIFDLPKGVAPELHSMWKAAGC